MTTRADLLFVLLCAALIGLARADEVGVGGLVFHVPDSWQGEPPATPARAGQWTIPGAPGGDGCEVIALFFGAGQGGDARTALQRWATTVTTPQGVPALGKFTERKTPVATVFGLDIEGTYASTPGIPGLPPLPRPDSALVGVVLDYSGGPVFLRLTGPADLVKKNRDAFERFVDSARVKAIAP
jgi:hypothetical protein